MFIHTQRPSRSHSYQFQSAQGFLEYMDLEESFKGRGRWHYVHIGEAVPGIGSNQGTRSSLERTGDFEW